MIDLERLIKDIGLNQVELAKLVGVSAQAITNVKQGKIKFPKEWQRIIKARFNVDLSNYTINPPNELKEDPNGKNIPFMKQDIFATISPAMSDAITLKSNVFINIPFFSKGEYAVEVTGHSMKGYINHGDWIVIKKVVNKDFIIFGEAYLIVTKSDNFKTVGFLNEYKDDYSMLYISKYNIEQFQGQAIPKEEILELYQVIGRFNKI